MKVRCSRVKHLVIEQRLDMDDKKSRTCCSRDVAVAIKDEVILRGIMTCPFFFHRRIKNVVSEKCKNSILGQVKTIDQSETHYRFSRISSVGCFLYILFRWGVGGRGEGRQKNPVFGKGDENPLKNALLV